MNLQFEVLSGGTVEINLGKCKDCKTKVCIDVCTTQGDILALVDGVPALKRTVEEVRKGDCTECLGCELNCLLYGNNAIKITLPVKYID